MEKKQTAVQWLQQKIKEQGATHYFSINELIKKSLEMEREQIEEAYKQGGDWEELPQPRFNNYYTQTFKP